MCWARSLGCDEVVAGLVHADTVDAGCQLAQAMQLDAEAPVKAAGHYAEAVWAFKAARQEGAADGAELERIDRFVKDCMERFSDCELRVKKERAAAQAASATSATASGRAAEGVQREDSGSEQRSWFAKTWAWMANDAASETGPHPGSASAKAAQAPSQSCGHGAAGQAPQSQPPARPPPSMPNSQTHGGPSKVPNAPKSAVLYVAFQDACRQAR